MASSNSKVGKLRPSQVVNQHGPGAVVDLPDLSVVVAGINHCRPTPIDLVPEPRLQAFLRVDKLYRPPQPGPGAFGGVPAFIFPEWLVCPRCRFLAPWERFTERSDSSGTSFQCPRNSPKHGKGHAPEACPARFMVACASGHLDDFPWQRWAHRNGDAACEGSLELIDTGGSGSPRDLMVVCSGCGVRANLGAALGTNAHSTCTGRRPWLGPHDVQSCDKAPRTILRGASNAYFSVVASALSVPPWSDPIHREIAQYLPVIQQADSIEKFKDGIDGGFYNLGDLLDRYSIEQIWAAAHPSPGEVGDLRSREWEAFIHPDAPADPGTEFEVRRQESPPAARDRIDLVVAALRLREVRALRGFTRLDSSPEAGDEMDLTAMPIEMARIGVDHPPSWLPAIDLRGEGVFIRLNEDLLAQWESDAAVAAEAERLGGRWDRWREERILDARPFKGMRYVLLHTLSHALIRQLSLDSGYSSSALRERIYCSDGSDPMAGILIYTASSDSDGSLGGLVDQARPDRLGPLLMDALRESARCSQDPLCGGQDLGGQAHLNGAACHACMLLAETSCEFSNRLLDRSVLVSTIGGHDRHFFDV